MILIKLIGLWLVTGCLVQALEIIRMAKTAHKYGMKFKFVFDLKCSLCDAIMWPNLIMKINEDK